MPDDRERAASFGHWSIAVARLVRAIAEAGMDVERELSALEKRYKRRDTGQMAAVRIELTSKDTNDPRREPEG